LNEIDLLKNSNVDDNINNYLSDSLNGNNSNNSNNSNDIELMDDGINDNDINDYLVINDKITNNKISNDKIENNNVINNKIENNKIKTIDDEPNDTINYDDIDFGVKIEELNITNITKPNTSLINTNDKKIIKIGKKKTNNKNFPI